MNRKMVLYLLGYVLRLESIFLLVPCVVAIFYRESAGWWFLLSAAISAVISVILTRKRPDNTVFYLKEGCVVTSGSWICMSLIGCLPFYLSGEIPKFTDALFETVSGFTTTGSSILNDVESMSVSLLFWRSFTHWIGGMGVLVFLLSIISLTGGSSMNLMRAESPGPSVSKLVPKVRATSRILYRLYIALTAGEFVFLLIGKLPFLDAVMLSLATAGTGGFGILNSSIGGYSAYIQWVIAIFMILFGVNFNVYYLILLRRFKDIFNIEEVRAYFVMIAAAVVFIFFNIYDGSMAVIETLRYVVFQVSALATSTGFCTTDFALWPSASKAVLILLMFVGACAGSTGGGLKVSRVLILFKSIKKEINAYLHPKSVRIIEMDGRKLDDASVHSVNVYFATFMVVFAVSFFLVSLGGTDFETSFSAVLTTLNNMGPGFGAIGPSCNFSELSVFTKYVLMFDMLAGRLELFPVLILLSPDIWKQFFTSHKSGSSGNRPGNGKGSKSDNDIGNFV